SSILVMLCVELSKLAIKIIGYDGIAIAERAIHLIPRTGAYAPARLARHNHDQAFPANFHTSDVSTRRLNGFHGAGQIGLFESRRASHKTSNCANFASFALKCRLVAQIGSPIRLLSTLFPLNSFTSMTYALWIA